MKYRTEGTKMPSSILNEAREMRSQYLKSAIRKAGNFAVSIWYAPPISKERHVSN